MATTGRLQIEIVYQLWIQHIDTQWQMAGMFESVNEADSKIDELFESGRLLANWHIIGVQSFAPA